MGTGRGSTRRAFFGDLGLVATSVLAAHGALASGDAVGPGKTGISRLRLKTAQRDELRRFYADALGLEVVDGTEGSISVRAGSTEIIFEDADPPRQGSTGPSNQSPGPFYHVAFNIPENKLGVAKQWLRPRCPIIKRPDGSEEYHFASWNAHAIYFLDPAGNILEFIARHNLRNAGEGPFSSADILYASEIALVVDDVRQAARAAGADLGMKTFAGSLSDDFAAVGDDHRLLILAKRGRPWLGGKENTAAVFPVRASLRGEPKGRLVVADLPYEVLGGD